MKTKKIILCSFVLASAVSMILLIQSCNSDKDDIANIPNIPVIDLTKTIEFSEYVTASNALKDKFLAFVNTLNQIEFEELMNNLNDDEYMQGIIEKAGVENDIKKFVDNKRNLFCNTHYLRLSVADQQNLFFGYFHTTNNVNVKTRSESSVNCDERRQKDYSWARAIADLELIGCTCAVEVPLVACACYAAALANYANNIRLADQAYEDCIRGR